MFNKDISGPEFQELLTLLAHAYGKNNRVTEFVRRLARLTKGQWMLVSLKAGGGGPAVNLNIRTRDRIINLSVDLAAKLNLLVFKKYTNEKNHKRRNRGQEELGAGDTES
jgi:hypothetical protein